MEASWAQRAESPATGRSACNRLGAGVPPLRGVKSPCRRWSRTRPPTKPPTQATKKNGDEGCDVKVSTHVDSGRMGQN